MGYWLCQWSWLWSRRGISGIILYKHEFPISWRSKAQRIVTSSSSETEWAVLLEAVKETIFVIQLLSSLNILIKLRVTIWVDNVGAIFTSDTAFATSCVKYDDIRYKYVNEYVEDGMVKNLCWVSR